MIVLRCGHDAPPARVGGRTLTICEACRKANIARTTPVAEAMDRHPAGKKRTFRWRDLRTPVID